MCHGKSLDYTYIYIIIYIYNRIIYVYIHIHTYIHQCGDVLLIGINIHAHFGGILMA